MRIIKSKWFLGVIISAIGWLSLSFIKIKLHENIVNKEVNDLEAKINDLEKSNSVLERFISHMSNPSFLEKQARIKLNYKAQGEEVVFIYPDESAKVSSSSNGFSKQNSSNYIKWWRWLLRD